MGSQQEDGQQRAGPAGERAYGPVKSAQAEGEEGRQGQPGGKKQAWARQGPVSSVLIPRERPIPIGRQGRQASERAAKPGHQAGQGSIQQAVILARIAGAGRVPG